MSGGWDVWEDIEARDGLVFGTAPLPEVTGGGLFWPSDPAVIVIDSGQHVTGGRLLRDYRRVPDAHPEHTVFLRRDLSCARAR